ncbi:ATP-binding protein [Streptomyces bathyalis]|uniref:ATP-binding protein n=1 Tax=Streptomyces bathyalis TaxID=2710756 RepID=A0A7T1T529_9ACTN|nr:ATP-binding protein [Streptomyces bathyalis]QPP06525.1 ATP-binding protein [Streptomyces bathyalis]
MVQHGNTQHGGEGNGGTEQGQPYSRRPVKLVVGRQLLTLNPVDGSEVEPCPPTEIPGEPRRLTQRERSLYARKSEAEAARSADPGGTHSGSPAAPGARAIPMLERDEERERLAGQLACGRSIRLTGLPGSGRTTLLEAVAADVADLAPDGVVWLSGYRRTATDLLQELFAAVHDAPLNRPSDEEMREALQGIGAVVIVDDLAFGGEALDQLLDATPECAFLFSSTPDIPPASGDVHVEEFRLTGLSRTACLELLEHAVRRPLTDEEADAAQDMWLASEESSGGLPLRFVQAGALLRYGGRAGELSGSRTSAMSARVAERLSSSARDALRFALALGGELPHHTQLPALVGDRQADEAEGELARAGLVTIVGGHYRLADAVADALTTAGFADGTDGRALMAAHHYGWWVDHPSVTPARVATEADAVLAAVQGAHRGGHASAAVLLARSAAPVLAASLRWSAWEKVLRGGLEAARTSGEVAQEAYFHHELGVLALCSGQLQRAAAELEASIAMRGALADQQGTFTGRRVLALTTDLLVAQHPGGPVAPGGADRRAVPDPAEPVPAAPVPAAPVPAAAAAAGHEEQAEPVAYEIGDRPTHSLAATLRGHRRGDIREGEPETARTVAASIANPNAGAVGAFRDATPTLVHPVRGSVAYGARRNLAAAGAGAVLIAVLATIVGLGRMPDDGSGPLDRGKPGSTSQRDDHNELNAEDPGSRSPGASQSSKSESPSESSKSPDASDSASKESPSESSSAPDEDPSSSEPGDPGGGDGSPTGSPGDSGSTDSGGTDDGGTDTGGTDDGGTDTGGTDDGGTDTGGTDDGGTDTGGTDDGGTDTGGTDTGGTDTGGTDTGGTDAGGGDTGGTDGGGTDDGGTDTGGTILGVLGFAPSTGPSYLVV